jgi:predicted ATPase
MTRTHTTVDRFIQRVRLVPEAETDRHPFTLPAVAYLARSGGLTMGSGATFLVGENSSGKSTLIEAIAIAAGFNPEGGSRNFRRETRATESALGNHLILTWATRKPRAGFFLRTESSPNVAAEIELLDREPSPRFWPAYGGIHRHERSHGEPFLDRATHEFGPCGLYLLDEPEAALSVRDCVALLARLTKLTEQGCQIIVATHSPILLALPGATIYEIADTGHIQRVEYHDSSPVRLTQDFLDSPRQFLRYQLTDDE